MRVGRSCKLFVGFTLGLIPIVPKSASAHPMGNFAICHYSRIETTPKSTRIHYIIDYAEIPTVEEMRRLDANHDGTVTKLEEDQYLSQKAMELNKGLALTENGKPVALLITARHLRRIPGAAGLDTVVVDMDLTASGPVSTNANFKYVDNNYPSRTGWKEIVVNGANGIALSNSSAPTVDLSSGLTKYPVDVPAPNVVGATFSAKISGISTNSLFPTPIPSRVETVSRTPQDSFTQVISQKALSPTLVLIGLVTAFFFGAMHALSPGHGKAMVAAYLVGSKGTTRHAVVLGLLVTVTHTLGVILLGLGTLLASKYVVPERLYPILTIISGAAVCCVGLWSLKQRMFGVTVAHHHHDHHADHDHTGDHDHTHDHVHDHAHDHDHDHSHDLGHSHGNGHYHSHVPEGPITMRSLVALGVSGGLIPCPSALVVLLAAVALHRIAYGMALLVTFSLGLASVLVAIGILVVKARTWLDSRPARPQWQQTVFKFAPALSSVFVTLIGFALILQAVSQVSP